MLSPAGDSTTMLTGRIALAALVSFAAALLLGPLAIHWLKGRFRERIDSASETLNKLHAEKKDTPTMGGLFIIGAVVVATLLCGDIFNPYVQLGMFTAVAFAALGTVDDWIKLRTTRRGLSARQKLLTQILLASVVTGWLFWLQREQPDGQTLIWPIGNGRLWLGWLIIPWGAFVIVGTSNGVNLTDGLDGLASGCTLTTGSAFVGLTYLAGHRTLAEYLDIPHLSGVGELAVVLAALVGAVLGFLWFNCHPAQVFMGDAGSLSIGALLALSALVIKQELLLVVIGGVFVVETLSVIMQIGWRRLTGHRILLCSPLHNHFVFRGDHEIKIVTRFWICSILLAILGLASLKIR